MHFGFVTCVQLGLACMQEIERVGGHLDVVITLPSHKARAKSGRVYVDKFCRQHGADFVMVDNINDDDAIEAVDRHNLDWLFVIGWSQIVRPRMLSAPRRGVVGMHPTLLPIGRGRAAIPWAILKGLTETGVTLFQLDEGVDTGPIIRQIRVPINPYETATSLYSKVAVAHRTLIRDVWPDLEADTVTATPQDETRATEWPGRTPEDGRIMVTMSVEDVDRLVRATTRPYPGAFWRMGDQIVRVWAGRPANGSEAPKCVFRVPLRDGSYDATDYDISNR